MEPVGRRVRRGFQWLGAVVAVPLLVVSAGAFAFAGIHVDECPRPPRGRSFHRGHKSPQRHMTSALSDLARPWAPGCRFAGASRSIGGMSPELAFKSVDGADAEANFPRHLADADALGELEAGAPDLVGFGTRAPQLAAHLARLAGEFAVAGELLLENPLVVQTPRPPRVS
jgi:hypothetical protein